MPRIAILFDNFGPYHLARLKAASSVCEVLAVEFGSSSAEYDWKASEEAGLKRVVLNPKGDSHQMSNEEFRLRLDQSLHDFHPEVVVVPGWGYRGALLGLMWCLSQRVPAIVMSESTKWDENRHSIKEWVKRRIISLFSAALVGGSPHRAYMQHLGMPEERTFCGYDAIDNAFFEVKTSEVQISVIGPPKPYFLASARFVPKKNLFRLLRAYALYRGIEVPSTTQSPWGLVLLGDGELRPDLEKLRSELGLEDCVQMPGFKQYTELPDYYARAGAFIHASTTEQWGLVVNEAMASGLPVLVSNRCGCAADLVKDGVNGYTFDPSNEEKIAELMLRISSDEDRRSEMGRKSQEIIANWGPDRFASGLKASVDAALNAPRKKVGLLDRLILWGISRR